MPISIYRVRSFWDEIRVSFFLVNISTQKTCFFETFVFFPHCQILTPREDTCKKTSQAQKRLFQTDHLEELFFESLWAYS